MADLKDHASATKSRWLWLAQGVLVVAPPVLQLLQARLGTWLRSVSLLRVVEAVVMLAVVFGVSELVFGQTRSLQATLPDSC